MIALKYKILDSKGHVIARTKKRLHAALIAADMKAGVKIRNEHIGLSGRVVFTTGKNNTFYWHQIEAIIIVRENAALKKLNED